MPTSSVQIGQEGPGMISGGDMAMTQLRGMPLDMQRKVLFGNPTSNLATQDPQGEEDGFSQTNYGLSSLYTGKNAVIRRTILRTLQGLDNFMYTVIFKLQPLPAGNKIKVIKHVYNETTLDSIPEQGTGRLMTQSLHQWNMEVERKGLAFMMEDGLAMTDTGIQQYRNNVKGLATATGDSITLDGYYHLLNAHGSGDYYRQFGMTKHRSTRSEITEKERSMWAMMSRVAFGFWRMTSDARTVLLNRRVAGDTLMLPSGTREYLRLNRKESISYDSVGPDGPRYLLRGGVGDSYIQTMGGVDIFESQVYNMTDSQEAQDPLTRVRTIGEFADSSYWDNANNKLQFYEGRLRDITIHDNESDNLVRISFESMVENSGLFEKTKVGRLTDDFGKTYFTGTKNIARWYSNWKMLQVLLKSIKEKAKASGTTSTSLLNGLPITITDVSRRRVAGASTTLNTDARHGTASAPDAETGLSRGRMGPRETGQFQPSIQTMYTPSEASLSDLSDLKSKAKRAELLAEISKANGALGPKTTTGFVDLSGTFRDWQKNGYLTVKGLQDISNVLSDEYSASGNRFDQFKTKPYVRYLRYVYKSEKRQKELYDSTGSEASTLLSLLYPNAVKRTSAVGSHEAESNQYMSETGDRRTALSTDGVEAPADSRPSTYGREGLNADLSERREEERIRTNLPIWYPGAEAISYSMLFSFFVKLRQAFRANGIEWALMRVKAIGRMLDLIRTRQTELGTARNYEAWKDGTLSSQYEQICDVARDIDSAAGVEQLYSIAANAGNLMAIAVTPMRNKEAIKAEVIQKFRDIQTENNKAAAALPKIDEDGTAEDRAIVTKLMTYPITKEVFMAFHEAGLPVAIDFALARPNMEYEMGSAIFLRRGPDTGGAFLGSANFQLTNEGNRKVMYGFFTCETGVLIWEPDNVHVMHNITCRRYVGGGGVGLWDNGSIQDRAEFANGKNEGEEKKSIFVIPLLPGEKIRKSEFDLTGRFAEDLDLAPDGSNGHTTISRVHYSMSASFSECWGFRHRPDAFDIRYYGNESRINTVCYRMTSWHDRIDSAGTIEPCGWYKAGNGHWGKYVYSGVKKDRCGAGDNGAVKTNESEVFPPHVRALTCC